MSPMNTSGIKPGPRLDTERLDTRVRGGDGETSERYRYEAHGLGSINRHRVSTG